MAYVDHEQQLAYQRVWDKENYQQKKEGQSKRRLEKRRKLDELKKTLKCNRCPENHPATLDFHHRDPKDKDVALGEVMRYDWSWEKILAEIAKCEVLCSNCHRKEHARLGVAKLGIARASGA